MARDGFQRPLPPSIRDVARRAGVSVGTASHVLNHPEVVRADVRDRVRRVIEELDYRPNGIARSLRWRRSMTIGVVLSDITTPFAATVARTVETCAAATGLSTVLADTNESPQREEQTIRTFYDKGIDGLILAPTSSACSFLEPYVARGWPIVAINRRPEGVVVPSVLSDNFGGAHDATRHLLEHGHRRIGVVARRAPFSSVGDRLEGYTAALDEAGIGTQVALIGIEEASVEGGIAAVRHLMAANPRPTALLSLSSVMSLGTVIGLREHAARVPDDVALIGFDDATWSGAVTPPMTSVALRAKEVGTHAADVLLRWVTDDAPPAQLEHPIPTLLIRRQSCGCPPLQVEDARSTVLPPAAGAST